MCAKFGGRFKVEGFKSFQGNFLTCVGRRSSRVESSWVPHVRLSLFACKRWGGQRSEARWLVRQIEKLIKLLWAFDRALHITYMYMAYTPCMYVCVCISCVYVCVCVFVWRCENTIQCLLINELCMRVESVVCVSVRVCGVRVCVCVWSTKG